jgi:Type II secretion system (T2SS), protein M subtype b
MTQFAKIEFFKTQFLSIQSFDRMQWNSYDGRARLAAGGTGLALLVALVIGFVWVFGTVQGSRAELAESRLMMERVALKRDQNADGNPEARMKRVLIGATASADVQARFQTVLKTIADRHGVEIDTLQMLKVEPAGGLMRHKLRLVAAIPERKLGDFFIALANNEPGIFVAGGELRPVPQRAARLKAAGQVDKMIALRIDLTAFSPAATKPQAAGGS